MESFLSEPRAPSDPTAVRTDADPASSSLGVPRIAVVGCGQWGQNHARTLASLKALAAVVDHHEGRARAMAEAYGVGEMRFEDVLGSERIDGVVLALPPHAHADHACRVLAAGKHLLVEKPIALTLADGERVVETAARANKVAMTGHVLRYHPAFERLLAMVEDGALGRIGYMHAHRTGLGRFHTDNDVLWDVGPHDLSLIMAIAGAAPVRVHGEGVSVLDGLSDFAHLHLEFASGLKAHIFDSRLSPDRDRRLTVIGDKAMMVFDDMAPWERKLALYRHRVWRRPSDDRWAFETADPVYQPIAQDLPLTRQCRHFLDCIASGQAPRTPVADGLAIVRVLSQGTVSHDREPMLFASGIGSTAF